MYARHPETTQRTETNSKKVDSFTNPRSLLLMDVCVLPYTIQCECRHLSEVDEADADAPPCVSVAISSMEKYLMQI